MPQLGAVHVRSMVILSRVGMDVVTEHRNEMASTRGFLILSRFADESTINEGFLPRAGLQGTFSIDLIHGNAMLHR